MYYEVISFDKKILKVWDKDTGKPFVNIEPPADINHVCIPPGSTVKGTSAPADNGLMIFALEQSKLLSYFIPSLGPAPTWCNFLENMTVSRYLKLRF